jgi:L-rhamnose mutarotase
MYTSGTTGNAKGVVLPHNYYLHFGEQKARHMRTTSADRIYNVYPMFNASGQCEAVMAAMAVGASVYTAPRFSATAFWDDIRAQGIEGMEIWRTGARLVMIATVADDYPRARAVPPEYDQWESLMWTFQRALPHAAPGQKWMPMTQIFDLARQVGTNS